MALPFFHRLGLDEFTFARDVGRDAQAGLRAAVAEDVLQHLVVAIRGLNEELCLVLIVDALLQLLELLGTFVRLDGQVAVEGEALSVETQ